jgi:hypothetical protein
MVTTFGVVACRSAPPPPAGAPPEASVASSAPVVEKSSAPAPAATVAPAGLKIPAMDLDAEIDPVGVDKSGDFAVPPSVDRVGWYKWGPGWSAEQGSIVIAGHVDSADQGKGAFFSLGRLDVDDEVTLTGPDGEDRAFKVVERKRYEKTAIPLDEYFARDGDVRLTLITCGGPFDKKTRHYRDNVVVTAVPV